MNNELYCLCSFLLYLFFPYSSQSGQLISKIFLKNMIKPPLIWLMYLTPSLSIFLFLIYLFICLNVSVYILVIYKYFKIRAQFAFWLNITEIQPSKYIKKNRNPIFLDSVLFFKFHLSCFVWNNIYKSYCLYVIYFIFHSLWSFVNVPWKRLGSVWLVWHYFCIQAAF